VRSTGSFAPANSSSASVYSFASVSASARASADSARARSATLTPVSRKSGSTPSFSASHSSVSVVGRVFPRSIWLTYSFENRPAARSLWVRPPATRSVLSRSPMPLSPCSGLVAVVK
jgi:hypothetical protein